MPKLIIITAPSGSGKTTIVKELLQQRKALAFSVSACTRPPRPGEMDGSDYYFIAPEDFKQRIDEDAFIEWEMVYPGKYYGTPRSELRRIWDSGRTPLVDIDVQGAMKIKAAFKGDACSIFIKTPSLEVLEARLIQRGSETPASLRERVDKAGRELEYAERFDAVIINDKLETAISDCLRVIDRFLGK